MTAPRSLLSRVIGCRPGTDNLPNVSDRDSRASVEIARAVLESLNLLRGPDGRPHVADADQSGQSSGTAFEREVAVALRDELAGLGRTNLDVRHPGRPIWEFEQYEHLLVLQRMIDEDRTGTLAVSVGRDYQVRPDITVGLPTPSGTDFLHASVSCKLTMRSDRAQNVRLEAAVMTRQRRGRQPHIVAVTAEPLPSRLASLARGTGDIDALYHVALPELEAAVVALGGSQVETLHELTQQGRLKDWDQLSAELALR